MRVERARDKIVAKVHLEGVLLLRNNIILYNLAGNMAVVHFVMVVLLKMSVILYNLY